MSERGIGAYVRWVVAAAGVVALAWLVLVATRGSRSGGEDRAAAAPPSAEACPVDAPDAPLDYTLKNVDDQPVRLSDFKGKVILLDFWATWCGPCKVEIPGFVEMQNQYGKDGLQVFGVSVDDTPDKLKPYIADMKMNYPVLQGLGHDDMLDAFGPMLGIPVSVIISRQGKICHRHMGLVEKDTFERQIKDLL
jgi:peroxiredoxin